MKTQNYKLYKKYYLVNETKVLQTISKALEIIPHQKIQTLRKSKIIFYFTFIIKNR